MCEYRNMEMRSCNHCCSGRAIIITYSEGGSVDLDIQNTKPTLLIMLLFVACPALHITTHYVAICGLYRSTYFPTLCCYLWPVPLYTFPHILLLSVTCPALHISPHYVAIFGLSRSTHFPPRLIGRVITVNV